MAVVVGHEGARHARQQRCCSPAPAATATGTSTRPDVERHEQRLEQRAEAPHTHRSRDAGPGQRAGRASARSARSRCDDPGEQVASRVRRRRGRRASSPRTSRKCSTPSDLAAEHVRQREERRRRRRSGCVGAQRGQLRLPNPVASTAVVTKSSGTPNGRSSTLATANGRSLAAASRRYPRSSADCGVAVQ